MRTVLIIVAIAVLALCAAGWWRYSSSFPMPSGEREQITAVKRRVLNRLGQEEKFKPHDDPPLGYTGIATPEVA